MPTSPSTGRGRTLLATANVTGACACGSACRGRAPPVSRWGGLLDVEVAEDPHGSGIP